MTRRIDTLLERSGLSPLTRSAWVEVDVDRLIANAAALTRLSHPAAVGIVVKADGYGHGLEMAARCAVAGGASWLCVADAAEAMRLRADGYAGRVFVLYPVPETMVPVMAGHRIDITVGDVAQAEAVARFAGPGQTALSVHLEIDTGMTRGGVSPDAALAAARLVTDGPGSRLVGVWTHLAAPEDPDRTSRQLSVFAATLSDLHSAGFEPAMVHAAASGGLLATDTSTHSLVRPGLSFYGVHPEAGVPLPEEVASALSVKAHAVRITEVPPGTEVGYAGTWKTPRSATIVTLPIGYADGWSRSSSPGTVVEVAGELAPIVGRISSDSLTVDVTGIRGVSPDSEFILMGAKPGTTVSDIAAARGTITWEVLQQLGARLARVYLSGARALAARAESSIEVITALEARLPGY